MFSAETDAPPGLAGGIQANRSWNEKTDTNSLQNRATTAEIEHPRSPRDRVASILLVICLWLPSAGFGAEESSLGEARRWLLRGRYEEAAEAYSQRLAEQPVAASVGLARCRIATGQIDQADAILADAVSQHNDDGRLAAERALLALGRGRYEHALKHAQAALASDPHQLAARWVMTELDRLHGRIERAADGYRWFLDHHRRHPDLSSEQLLWIGRAAAQHARWERDSQQFRRLVGNLYPECLRRDPDWWPARYEMGLLLLEKYNEPDARAQFQAALAINPHAAEVHAALARLALQSFDLGAAEASVRRALEIDGQLLAAHQLHADRLLAEQRVSQALEVLQTARQIHPLDEETLGRSAAVYGVLDGWQTADGDSRLSRLQAEVIGRNPHCGRFFAALADALDGMRRYPQAADFYRQAIERLPRLMYARGRLGMILMRLGEEAEARRLLDASFADDPYNVRVKNMLEVLDVLQDYAVLETEHFILRYDRDENETLATFAARTLEEQIYPEIVARLGYQPPEKTLIQIFSRARNSSGQAWFSARMVGLPFIGTVGACAGRVVAIASPTELPVKFNWARVLRHEFVHVVNLQQTDFQIPHWYTEALAVLLEEQRRPDQWTEVLVRRARADRLFDLDTINRGFIRPRNQDEWTLAYCQALLYAEFIQEQFGPQKLIELLDAYAEGLTTRDAILQCFGLEQKEFERRYLAFLQPIIAQAPVQHAAPSRGFAELLRAADRDLGDATGAAELAEAYLQRHDPARARKYAEQALQHEPGQQQAAYVLSRLHLADGDTRQAVRILEAAIVEISPHDRTLALLAGLRLQAGDFAEAERLYRLGAKRFPLDANWLRSLTRVFLESSDQRKLSSTLAELVERDPENPLLVKKLLELSLAEGDYEQAARWARTGLEIDVMDADFHTGMARATQPH